LEKNINSQKKIKERLDNLLSSVFGELPESRCKDSIRERNNEELRSFIEELSISSNNTSIASELLSNPHAEKDTQPLGPGLNIEINRNSDNTVSDFFYPEIHEGSTVNFTYLKAFVTLRYILCLYERLKFVAENVRKDNCQCCYREFCDKKLWKTRC
jgi:hypothetical protein